MMRISPSYFQNPYFHFFKDKIYSKISLVAERILNLLSEVWLRIRIHTARLLGKKVFIQKNNQVQPSIIHNQSCHSSQPVTLLKNEEIELTNKIFSNADWSNRLGKLSETNLTINHEEELISGSLSFADPQKNISETRFTLSLEKIINTSQIILKRTNLKIEERLKIAFFLIDLGQACERIEKVKRFNPLHRIEGVENFNLIDLGKSYLNYEAPDKKLSSSIEIVYIENFNDYKNAFQEISSLIALVSVMLTKAGYNHESSQIKIDSSQTHKIIVLETSKGKKFIKINARGGGLNEYLGTLLFNSSNSYLSTIPIIAAEKLIVAQNIELLVQPFVPSAFVEGGTLFEKICQMEFQEMPKTIALIKSIYSDSLKLSLSTMNLSTESCRNDDLFYERLKTKSQDGIVGRIEQIYTGKKFKLHSAEIPWEVLKTQQWSIDGVIYKETLEELISQAREELNPEKPRLIGISHGDWHENNIITNEIDGTKVSHEYTYIDLERSGSNDLIEDAALFLTHLTIYADYINPRYSPNLFKGNKIVSKAFEKSRALKDRQITVNASSSLINMQGIGSFGTLESRVKVARLFIDNYYTPLVNEAVSKYNIKLEAFDNHLKFAILLRLFGGREVTKWTAQDQMKIIGLIYKSIGTPINKRESRNVIERFFQALEES